MTRSGAGRRILRNFFNLSAGEIVARVVHFAAFAHLARVLGAGEFGRLGIVLTLVSYLMIPVLQGFDSVGMRDVARDRARLGPYAGNILSMRLLSALLTWGALWGALRTSSLDAPTRSLLLLFGLTLFASAVSVKWAFQAVEETRPVAVAGIVAQLAFAAGAFTVRGPDQILRVPLCQLGGELAAGLLLYAVFCRRFGRLAPGFRLTLWKQLLQQSAPLAVSTVLGTLLFNFDVLALAYFQPADAVGLYTAAYKLVLVFSTLLTLFQLSLFPTLARVPHSGQDVGEIAGRVLRYLAAAFVPLGFLGLFVAPRLLAAVFGPEYAAASKALQILIWSLPWMALRAVFRIILVAYNLQALDLSAVFAGTVVNVAVDLLLVPRFGTTGAAIATLSSELVIFFRSYRFVWRRVQPVFVLARLLRPALASVPMILAAWFLSPAPLAAQISGAAAVYLGALFFVRGVTWREIATLYHE